jgi:YD repeat-containing protein
MRDIIHQVLHDTYCEALSDEILMDVKSYKDEHLADLIEEATQDYINFELGVIRNAIIKRSHSEVSASLDRVDVHMNGREQEPVAQPWKKCVTYMNGELDTVRIVERDDLGRVIRKAEAMHKDRDFEFDPQNPVNEDRFEYDEHGNRIRTISFDAAGQRREAQFEYKYDEQGRKVETRLVGESGKTQDYIFDDQGKTLEINWNEYGRRHNVITESFVYDERGLLMLASRADGYMAYQYDDQGNTVKVIRHSDVLTTTGMIAEVFTKYMEYNENGLVSKFYTSHKWDDSPESFSDISTYEYDALGREVKVSKIRRTDGSLIETTECDYYGNSLNKKELRQIWAGHDKPWRVNSYTYVF